MSQFLKSIQPILNEIVCDLTGLTVSIELHPFDHRTFSHCFIVQLSDRFNPYKKLFEDAIIHRSNVNVERSQVKKHLQG